MCASWVSGIAGVRPIGRDLLLRMNEGNTTAAPTKRRAPGARHRPGHKRLSIIDLATDSSRCSTKTAPWRGLQRRDLQLRRTDSGDAHGHTFRTRSDTKSSCMPAEAWGEDCVNRFAAVCILLWDEKRQTLFMARGQAGVNRSSSHAAGRHGGVRLGAEALMVHGNLEPPDRPAPVEDYFALGYVRARTVSVLHTSWRREILVHAARAEPAQPRTYWRCVSRGRTHRPKTRGRAARAAERERAPGMIYEVPRARLSGGVDSSAVVSVWPACPRSGETCSIAFDDPAFENRATQRGRAALRQRHFVDRVESDDFADRLRWPLCTTALCRQLGHSDLPRVPAGAQACDGGAVG